MIRALVVHFLGVNRAAELLPCSFQLGSVLSHVLSISRTGIASMAGSIFQLDVLGKPARQESIFPPAAFLYSQLKCSASVGCSIWRPDLSCLPELAENE